MRKKVERAIKKRKGEEIAEKTRDRKKYGKRIERGKRKLYTVRKMGKVRVKK